MTIQSVVNLLKDNERELLQERRAVDRKPFVRPVVIVAGKNRDEIHDAFSRDLSPLGMGLVSRINWADQTIASLQIDTLRGKTLSLRSITCWTKPYGTGWYITGWKFSGEER